jgi:uncharacterized protein YehS (DUF1456 family)
VSRTVTIDMSGQAETVIDENAPAQDLPEGAIKNEDGTITLSLRKPVTLQVRGSDNKTAATTFAELIFHELVGADLRAISDARDSDRVDVMLSRALKIAKPVARALFDQMSRRDAEAAVQVATFL